MLGHSSGSFAGSDFGHPLFAIFCVGVALGGVSYGIVSFIEANVRVKRKEDLNTCKTTVYLTAACIFLSWGCIFLGQAAPIFRPEFEDPKP